MLDEQNKPEKKIPRLDFKYDCCHYISPNERRYSALFWMPCKRFMP